MARPADRVPGYGRRRRSRTVAGVVRAGAALPRRGHMRTGVERGGSAAARGDVGNLAMCPARPCSRPACGARPTTLARPERASQARPLKPVDEPHMRSLAILLLLLAARCAHAEIHASLPLHGYSRPGSFIPVRLEGMTSGTEIELAGEGVTPTRVAVAGGALNVVVPVLTTGSADGMVVRDLNTGAAIQFQAVGNRMFGD